MVTEGEHSGKLRFAVSESPFVTKNIIVDLSDVSSLVLVGESIYDSSSESNYVKVDKYICEASGE